MPTYHATFEQRTSVEIDVLDITSDVLDQVAKSGFQNGQVCVFVGGSTGSVTTIEYEPGVVRDLVRSLEQIAPPKAHYDHDAAWGDGNGYSHVLAALLGPSRVFPLVDGRVPLGTWQQIVLVDCDNKPRRRTIHVQVTGE